MILIFFFDEDLDCLDGQPKNKQRSVNIVKDIMLANELINVWRTHHPDKKRFTWRKPNSTIQRRLDFRLISNSTQEDIFSTDIARFNGTRTLKGKIMAAKGGGFGFVPSFRELTNG